MKKRFWVTVGLAAVGCAAAFGAANAATIVSVTSETPTVSQGDSFVVDVAITGASDLYGFQFDLTFDPTVVSATTSIEGALLPTGGSTFFIAGTIDNTGGVITATADSLVTAIGGVTGDGILASFSFTGTAAGITALSLSNVLLLDSNVNPIDSTTTDGSVAISPVPIPAAGLLLSTGLAMLAGRRRRRTA